MSVTVIVKAEDREVMVNVYGIGTKQSTSVRKGEVFAFTTSGEENVEILALHHLEGTRATQGTGDEAVDAAMARLP